MGLQVHDTQRAHRAKRLKARTHGRLGVTSTADFSSYELLSIGYNKREREREYIIIIIIIIRDNFCRYSAILWCAQTHCASQHSPTFSKFTNTIYI